MVLKTLALFIVTAFAEILGCYLPYLWLKEGNSIWLLIPAAISNKINKAFKGTIVKDASFGISTTNPMRNELYDVHFKNDGYFGLMMKFHF